MRNLRLSIFLLCVFGLFLSAAPAGALDTRNWKEASSDHFIIKYLGEEAMARDILDKSEAYYTGIAQDVGYPRYSEFWTWENKVKIYLYPDHSSFIAATGQPEWSQGMADYTQKEIVGFVGSKDFLDSILPHEMAHLIFRDFIGFKSDVPLWIDEGVAQWCEKARRAQARAKAKELFNNNSLLSLQDMMNLDIRHVTHKDAVYMRSTKTKDGSPGVLFLNAESLISTYYLEAVSLIDFLIESYGADNFSHFCRQLRDGKPLEESLRFVYSLYFKDTDEMERLWRKYIAENT